MHATTLELLIYKERRELLLFDATHLQATYAIAIGRSVLPDKQFEGDEATPLGEFYICAKNPRSKFFRSLCLSYPNAAHAARGLAEDLIDALEYARILDALASGRTPPQHTRLGGEIYIHGSAAGPQAHGTRGCIALDNNAMEVLFERVPLGTPVRIEP